MMFFVLEHQTRYVLTYLKPSKVKLILRQNDLWFQKGVWLGRSTIAFQACSRSSGTSELIGTWGKSTPYFGRLVNPIPIMGQILPMSHCINLSPSSFLTVRWPCNVDEKDSDIWQLHWTNGQNKTEKWFKAQKVCSKVYWSRRKRSISFQIWV